MGVRRKDGVGWGGGGGGVVGEREIVTWCLSGLCLLVLCDNS